MNIQYFIEKSNQIFDPSIFESGQCHTFALALHKRFNGTLTAIIRYNPQDDLHHYSHMVMESNGECYDINGKNADEKWCKNFTEDDEFDFKDIKLENLDDFLKEWNCFIDYHVLKQLESL